MAALSSSFSSLTISPKFPHTQSSSSSLLSLPSKSPLRTPSSLPHPFHKLHLSSSPLIAKYSDADAAVLEAEATDIVASPVADDAAIASAAKREEIFAVVMIGGRQYIVFPGRYLYTQRLKGANVNDKVVLNKVLLVGTKTSTWIGKPIVQNAAVHAVVEEQGLDHKVVVFKYKRKKNYRRNIGHRQPITRIRITGITGYVISRKASPHYAMREEGKENELHCQ